MAFSSQSPQRSGGRIILFGREVAGGVPLAETPGSTKILPAVSSQPAPTHQLLVVSEFRVDGRRTDEFHPCLPLHLLSLCFSRVDDHQPCEFL